MSVVTLTHCVAVQVYPSDEFPQSQNAVVQIHSGGSAGDGTVEIHLNDPVSPPAEIVPTGKSSQIWQAPDPTRVFFHYRRSSTGPVEIEVDFTVLTA